jgi:acyl-CoA synthetase (NDP forming)
MFHPRGIAVIGASVDPARIGGQPIQALVTAGYAGRIYPVNPKYDEVAGLRCYATVEQIDGPCDLALIALPAVSVPQVIRSCGAASIPHAIVLSGGFKETGDAGRTLEFELQRAARESRVRVLGPNCQGMVVVADRVYATFGAPAGQTDLRAGSVSMAFQSGGFGFSVALLCEELGVGFRYCVSTGNEADIATPELIETFVDDPQTRIVCAYIEGISDGRALMRAAGKALDAGKPLLIWKGGKTAVGASAAASHTASMTGSYAVYRAAFRQSGVLEVTDAEELVDLYRVFGQEDCLPAGHRIGVLGISGGAAIVFADTAVESGLVLPAFGDDTAASLARIVPAFGSCTNPADITADIFNDISRFKEAVRVVLRDPQIDQLCVLLASLPGEPALAAAKAIASVAEGADKPVLVGWSARRHRAQAAYDVLERARVPIIQTPVRLARAAGALSRYAQARRARRRFDAPATAAAAHIEFPHRTGTLPEPDSKRLLAAYGIPISRDAIVPVGGDPVVTARALSFPLAVKVVSSDIPHKTDVGAVRLGVPDAAALRIAFDDVLCNATRAVPDACIEGVMLSEMVTEGLEMLVGVVSDPNFGPVVAVGFGGTLTEVLRDLTYRVAPFDLEVASEMISELRGSAVLRGVRGAPPCDVDALARALVSVSQMAWELRERLQELDINPLFVRPEGMGVVAADGLAVLRA